MQHFVPDYYPAFHCIASACKHSCCVGWEIDIDADTRAAYRAVGGSLGRRLAEQIEDGEDGPHFRLDAEERCPFLRHDGLCDLILTLGEGALCQICRDHPRYRNVLAGRVEIGLGLCCEAAADLILSRRAPMRWIVVRADDDEGVLWPEEIALLAARDEAVALMQDRTQRLRVRADAVLAAFGIPAFGRTPAGWARFFRGLNLLEPAWGDRLDALSACGSRGWPELAGEWTIPFEQLTVYFLCRHLPGAAEDGRAAERAAFALLSTAMIAALFAAEGEQSMSALADLARCYSAEIEYDEDNVEAVLEEIERLKGECI